jgi:hypothetical protein
MSQGRATEEALAALHTKIAEDLIDAIDNGEVLRDRDGAVVMGENEKPLRAKASAAILNVARQFLKDNDIKAMPAKDSPLDRLAKTIPANFVPYEGDEEPGSPAKH